MLLRERTAGGRGVGSGGLRGGVHKVRMTWTHISSIILGFWLLDSWFGATITFRGLDFRLLRHI